jgi:hypothetical protein
MDLKLKTITFADVAANYVWHVWQRFTAVLKPLKFNWFKVTAAVFYFCYLNKIFLQMYEAIPVAAAELTAAGVKVYSHQQTSSFIAWWLAYIAANAVFYKVFPLVIDYVTPTVTAVQSEFIPLKVLTKLADEGSLVSAIGGVLSPIKPYQVADIDTEIKRPIAGSRHNEQEVFLSGLPNWYAVTDGKLYRLVVTAPPLPFKVRSKRG